MASDLRAVGDLIRIAETTLDRRIGEATLVAQKGKALKLEVASLEELLLALDEAAAVLNSYADSRQAELQRRIETLLTHGLQTIFGNDMTFHITQAKLGKQATADFIVRSTMPDGSVVETSILDARGGGVAAVAGFLLRLLILLLKDTPAILFLDETFAQLSAEYEPRLAEFIKELVEKTKVQVVMVTHSTAYTDTADAQYRFSLEDGVTKVDQEVG